MNYLYIYTNTFKIESYSNGHHIQYDFALEEILTKTNINEKYNMIDIFLLYMIY